ncbi:MAG: hypothetical protein M1837_004484 [Sclerophora amabilis]|nr:MAG: hypothetical protein M1837_004484 [Sclerophora amabilis]
MEAMDYEMENARSGDSMDYEMGLPQGNPSQCPYAINSSNEQGQQLQGSPQPRPTYTPAQTHSLYHLNQLQHTPSTTGTSPQNNSRGTSQRQRTPRPSLGLPTIERMNPAQPHGAQDNRPALRQANGLGLDEVNRQAPLPPASNYSRSSLEEAVGSAQDAPEELVQSSRQIHRQPSFPFTRPGNFSAPPYDSFNANYALQMPGERTRAGRSQQASQSIPSTSSHENGPDFSSLSQPIRPLQIPSQYRPLPSSSTPTQGDTSHAFVSPSSVQPHHIGTDTSAVSSPLRLPALVQTPLESYGSARPIPASVRNRESQIDQADRGTDPSQRPSRAARDGHFHTRSRRPRGGGVTTETSDDNIFRNYVGSGDLQRNLLRSHQNGLWAEPGLPLQDFHNYMTWAGGLNQPRPHSTRHVDEFLRPIPEPSGPSLSGDNPTSRTPETDLGRQRVVRPGFGTLAQRNGTLQPFGAKRATKHFIESLKQVDLTSLEADDRSCSICMEPFGVPEPIKRKIEHPIRLPCNHVFGQNCIKTWLEAHCTCPVCREDVDSESIPRSQGHYRQRSRVMSDDAQQMRESQLRFMQQQHAMLLDAEEYHRVSGHMAHLSRAQIGVPESPPWNSAASTQSTGNHGRSQTRSDSSQHHQNTGNNQPPASTRPSGSFGTYSQGPADASQTTGPFLAYGNYASFNHLNTRPAPPVPTFTHPRSRDSPRSITPGPAMLRNAALPNTVRPERTLPQAQIHPPPPAPAVTGYPHQAPLQPFPVSTDDSPLWTLGSTVTGNESEHDLWEWEG